MRVEERGLIYDAQAQPAAGRTAAFTGLCRLRNGALIASYQVGEKKHAHNSRIWLGRSDDAGRTWAELPNALSGQVDGTPGSLSSGQLLELPGGRWLLCSTWFDRSEPERPLFDPLTEGILRSRQLLARSDDEGRTWSDWSIIPTPGLTGCAATGEVLGWESGLIGYAFESFKEYDDPAPARHAAWLLVSPDQGRTFPQAHLVARDPAHRVYYWDQRLCPAGPDGEYVALFWTHDRGKQQDLRVHLKRGSIHDPDPTVQPVETPIPGQIAAPLLLADGRLLAFVVDRGRPGTMTLWSSPDGGDTWPEGDRLVVYTHDERALLTQGREQIDFAQYWEDMGKWTFGHPAIRDLGQGKVLVAYYAGTPSCLSGHWARIDTSQPA
ncbi:MAG: sialidase family protein [Planctomycetales bacterium]